jgi:hypothetical protein
MTLGVAILACGLAVGTCHAAGPDVRSYAVRVTAPAGSAVRLGALDLPAGWIASFCTPRACSPFRVTVPVRTGSATIQLSYVRRSERAVALRRLHVAARDAAGRSDALVAVRP